MAIVNTIKKLFHHSNRIKVDSKMSIIIIEDEHLSSEAREAYRKLEAFRSAMYRWSDLRGYGDEKPLDGLALAVYEKRALPHLKELEAELWKARHSA